MLTSMDFALKHLADLIVCGGHYVLGHTLDMTRGSRDFAVRQFFSQPPFYRPHQPIFALPLGDYLLLQHRSNLWRHLDRVENSFLGRG
jgi:hypothetical protein